MIIDVWNHESENEQIQFDRFATNQTNGNKQVTLLMLVTCSVYHKKDAQKQSSHTSDIFKTILRCQIMYEKEMCRLAM